MLISALVLHRNKKIFEASDLLATEIDVSFPLHFIFENNQPSTLKFRGLWSAFSQTDDDT